jgi:hypothetical protein
MVERTRRFASPSVQARANLESESGPRFVRGPLFASLFASLAPKQPLFVHSGYLVSPLVSDRDFS